MGVHPDASETVGIDEATRVAVLADWTSTRNAMRTGDKFNLTPKQVKRIVYDAARVARLPENVASDIHAERCRLEEAMAVLWPRVRQGELKAIEVWRKLGVDLRLLTGWQAPASSGFHLSVGVTQVVSGSAKLEELLNNLMALPAPANTELGNEVGNEPDEDS